MRKAFIFLSVLLAALTLQAKTYTASTEHFDIIYTDETMKTADAIYKNCEALYDEVSELFGYTGNISIPVYIESDVKQLNAYETQWPYNRIVLYDATDTIGNLSNVDIVLIFKHELTHALMFEIKPNSILRIGSKIFGDWFSLQGLQLYPSYVEGSAVMSESINGRGRLNNNFTMQRLKQAKLEGKFPSFFGAIGMRDIYPSGDLYYLFGGAFTEYLRQNYGEENFRTFLNKTGRFSLVEETGYKFNKVYGNKQKYMWQDFADSVEIPETYIDANPITKEGRFENLKYYDGKIYVTDSTENAVFELEDSGKLKKTFNYISTNHQLSFGSDGSRLTLCDSNDFTRIILTDKTGKQIRVFGDYKDGTIVNSNGKTYYLLYRNKSQETYIDLLDNDFNVIYTIDLGWGITAGDFCSPMDEVAAFIVNNAGKRNIVCFNVETKKTAKAENPDGILITSINASPIENNSTDVKHGLISFSWTTEEQSEALVRYGEMHLTKIGRTISLSQSLSEVDINGSISYPVRTGDTVTYIARFYDNDKICTVDVKTLKLGYETDIAATTYEGPSYEELYGEPEIYKQDYKAGKYFLDGSLLPLPSYSLDVEGFPLGATFITMDPTESWSYEEAFSYSPKAKQFISLSFIERKIKDFDIKAQFELQFPIVKTYGALGVEYSKTLGKPNETVTVSNVIGEYSESFTILGKTRESLAEGLSIADKLSATYTNKWKKGPKTTDYMGYSFDAQATLSMTASRFGNNKWGEFTDKKVVTLAHAKFDFPSLGLAHYSIYATAAMNNIKPAYVSAQVQLMPLCLEIQNGFDFMGLYFNRFVFDMYGYAQYSLSDKEVALKATAVAYVTFSESVGGMLTANIPISLGCRVDYDVKEKELTPGLYLNIGLDLLSGIKSNDSAVKVFEL